MSRETSRIAWDSTWENLAADTRAMYGRDRRKFSISANSDTQRISSASPAVPTAPSQPQYRLAPTPARQRCLRARYSTQCATAGLADDGVSGRDRSRHGELALALIQFAMGCNLPEAIPAELHLTASCHRERDTEIYRLGIGSGRWQPLLLPSHTAAVAPRAPGVIPPRLCHNGPVPQAARDDRRPAVR